MAVAVMDTLEKTEDAIKELILRQADPDLEGVEILRGWEMTEKTQTDRIEIIGTGADPNYQGDTLVNYDVSFEVVVMAHVVEDTREIYKKRLAAVAEVLYDADFPARVNEDSGVDNFFAQIMTMGTITRARGETENQCITRFEGTLKCVLRTEG